MPSTLPDGERWPDDGALPGASLAGIEQRRLGIYLHVPFCRTRCGYCDFNTYTAAELGPGASHADYADTVIAELELAAGVLGERAPQVSTVFVGGGTPTLLPSGDLARMLEGVRRTFGLAPGAEVTTESNPDSVDAGDLEILREAGFTRISFGMQSAATHVLRVLEREHTPGRALEVVAEARAAGFEQVSLDLIYGTPSETMADWQASLQTVLDAGVDHVSAYSLIVEEGTRLAGQVRRGVLPEPDEDDLADKYLMAEEMLSTQGFSAYEVSNWAISEASRCRHNLAYWRGDDWWGIGPGAHSHIGGARFWNRKHPAAHAARIAQGLSPAQAGEVLDAETRRIERILLELRLAEGLDLGVLTATERARIERPVAEGLAFVEDGRLRLTLSGRLLADGVVRDLLD